MGWFQELLGGRWALGGFEQEAAEASARTSILANAERDRARARQLAELDDEPAARWRWHHGRWERWSQLEATFLEAEPPESLLAHAMDAAGPIDGEELTLVDGTWGPAGRAEASVGEPVPGATAVDEHPPAPPPSPAPSAELEPPVGPEPATPADFEAQLEAWRRRR